MDLLRNTGSGTIHRPECKSASKRGVAILVPWLMAESLDSAGVARLSEENDIHLCRCLLPLSCRCHKCTPAQQRP